MAVSLKHKLVEDIGHRVADERIVYHELSIYSVENSFQTNSPFLLDPLIQKD
jgi:hypothetical protein